MTNKAWKQARRPVWVTQEEAHNLQEFLAWVDSMEEAGRMNLDQDSAATFAAIRPQLDKIEEGQA